MNNNGIKRVGNCPSTPEDEEDQCSDTTIDMTTPASERPPTTSPSRNGHNLTRTPSPGLLPTPIPSTGHASEFQEEIEDDEDNEGDPYIHQQGCKNKSDGSQIAHCLPRRASDVGPPNSQQEDHMTMQRYVVDKIEGIMISKNPKLLSSRPDLQRKLVANICRNWTTKALRSSLQAEICAKSPSSTDQDSILGSCPSLSRVTTSTLDDFITDALVEECQNSVEPVVLHPDDTIQDIAGLEAPMLSTQIKPPYHPFLILENEDQKNVRSDSAEGNLDTTKDSNAKREDEEEGEDDDDEDDDGSHTDSESDEEMSLWADEVEVPKSNRFLPLLGDAVSIMLDKYAAILACANGSAQDATGTSFTPGRSGEPASGKSRKRRADDGGDEDRDEEGDEDESRGNKKRKKPEAKDQPKPPTWACPFEKRYPVESRKCRARILTKIGDVKQHVKRAHKAALLCRRCQQLFDTDEALAEHSARQVPCEARQRKDTTRMNLTQTQSLMDRTPLSQDSREQWYWIFEKLFPGVPRPKSPYQDPIHVDRLTKFVEVMKEHGMNMLIEILRDLGATFGPNEERHLEQALEGTMSACLVELSSSHPPTLSEDETTGVPGLDEPAEPTKPTAGPSHTLPIVPSMPLLPLHESQGAEKLHNANTVLQVAQPGPLLLGDFYNDTGTQQHMDHNENMHGFITDYEFNGQSINGPFNWDTDGAQDGANGSGGYD